MSTSQSTGWAGTTCVSLPATITDPCCGPRERGDATVAARRFLRLVEVALVQRADLVLVREEDVDFFLDELQPLGSVPVDAERVGQRQRHLVAGLVRDPRGLAVRLLGLGPVPEVALEVHDPRRRHHVGVDVVGTEQRGRTEVRVHRALRVGRHDDEAAPGARPAGRGRRRERDAGRADVVREDVAELVAADLAEVGGAGAEGRDADDGVRGRAARDLDRGTHRVVQLVGAGLLDERHRAPVQRQPLDERFGLVAQHVDEGVADAEDVELTHP